MFDLVAIGHAARDEFEGDPEWRVGGTAVYAAAPAARLGDRVALLTRAGPRERGRLARPRAELGNDLPAHNTAATPKLAFRHTDGNRKLPLKARAPRTSGQRSHSRHRQ